MKPIIKDRNERICQLYREGSSLSELANRFHLTKSWVGHIVKKGGLTKDDRAKLPPSGRVVFTGTYLRAGVKDALRREAKYSGVKMSVLISQWIEKELKSRGAVFTVLSNEIDVPLPLEG